MKEVGEARSATSGIRGITPDGTITSGVTPQTINTLISGSDVSGLRVEHAEIGRTDSSTHSHTHTHNHTHFHGMPVSVPTASSAYVSSTSQSSGAVSVSASTSAAFGELKKGAPSVLLPQVLNFRQFVMVETPGSPQAEDKDEKEVKANVTAPSHSTLSRCAYLEQIKESLGSSLTPTAVLTPLEDFVLFGRGGVGKSWLAMKYAHEQHAAGHYQLIGWVDCNKNIDSEFERLAKRWFDWGEEKPAVGEINWVERLYTSLSKVPSWLLIFDDAKDEESIASYLPRENGEYLSSQINVKHHALVTSRHHGWTDSCVRVGGLSLSEVQQLAEKRGIREAASQYQQLAEALGFHTLSISQALLYIKCERKYRDVSIANYLEELNAIPKDIFEQQHALQRKKGPKTAYPLDVLRSLALSLNACLEELAKESTAYRLLAEHVFIALGYLGEQSIPKHLLDSLAEDVPSLSLSSDNISEPSGGRGADNATEGHSSTYTALSSQLSMPPSSLSPQSVCRRIHRTLIDYGIVDYDKHTGHYRLHQLMHLTLSLRYCAPDNPEKRAEQLRYLERKCCEVFTYAPHHTEKENQPSVDALASIEILVRYIEAQWPEPTPHASGGVLSGHSHSEENYLTLLLRISQLCCYYNGDDKVALHWIDKALSRLLVCEDLAIDLSRDLKAEIYLHRVYLSLESDPLVLLDAACQTYLKRVWEFYGDGILANDGSDEPRVTDKPVLMSVYSVIALRLWSGRTLSSRVDKRHCLGACLHWLEAKLDGRDLHDNEILRRYEYELRQVSTQLHDNRWPGLMDRSLLEEGKLLDARILKAEQSGLPRTEVLCRYADLLVEARELERASTYLQEARNALVSSQSPAAAFQYVKVSYQLADCYKRARSEEERQAVLIEILAFIQEHSSVVQAHEPMTQRSVFHLAARVGDIAVLNYFSKAGYNCLTPVATGAWGTPLHVAIRYDQVETITWLIKKRQCIDDLNIQSKKGYTPLMLAINLLCEEAIQLLLGTGISLEEASEHWARTVSQAAEHSANLLAQLIDRGVNVNCRDGEGQTSLLLAASHNQLDATKILLAHGAAINAVDSRGESALMLASSRGYSEMVALFIVKNADVDLCNKYGDTALSKAAEGGYAEVAKQLITVGASINSLGRWGSPLCGAVGYGDEDTIALFLASGADVNLRPPGGASVLMVAARQDHEAIIKQLFAVPGIALNAQNRHGQTALHIAIVNNRTANALLLIDADADIEICDKDGRTPLFCACWVGQRAVVERLIEAGADRHKTDKAGRSIWYAASRNGYDHILTILKASGTNVPDGDITEGFADYYLFRQQNAEQAMDYYRLAITLAPKTTEVYHNAACCADVLGEHEEAETYFLKGIIELAPTSELYAEYAYFLYRRGNYTGALERVAQSSVANIIGPLFYRKIEADILAEPMRGFILERGEVTLSSKVLCYYIECLCYLGMAQYEKLDETLAAWQHSSTQSDDKTEQALFTVTQAWIEKTIKVGSSALLRDEDSLERSTSESIQPDVADSVCPSGEPLLPIAAPSEIGCHAVVTTGAAEDVSHTTSATPTP